MQPFFVLGHPVAHSKSPVMHNAAYRALGLPWEYGLADCATESEARAFLASDSWLGLNVTTPYKPLALEVATQCTAAAVIAQGANVLVRCNGHDSRVGDFGGELLADNTDGAGCVTFLRRSGIELEGARAVVCGTGPTSLAIAHALAQAGTRKVTLLGRSAERSRHVLVGMLERCERASVALSASLSVGDYERGACSIAQADLIIDATPLGMRPGDPAPFDTSLLTADQVVLDVVYGHGETALLTAARAAGCTAFDGFGMLVGQAVQTVRDFATCLHAPLSMRDVDLFALMADAAQPQAL